MPLEIERKFLVTDPGWRALARRSQRMQQGYLIDAALVVSGQVRCSARVRIAGDAAWLNVKSAQLGPARQEYEYAIPRVDAQRMLQEFCNGSIDKTRHYVPFDGVEFEVDEFHGDNDGLVPYGGDLNALDGPKNAKQVHAMRQGMLLNGVDWWGYAGMTNCEHSPADVDATVAAMEATIGLLAAEGMS